MSKKKKEDIQSEQPEVIETPETEQAEAQDDIAEKLAQCEAELLQTKDKYLRTLAEYDNFRKRTQREREALYISAKSDAVIAFLPVYDNVERALMQHTEDAAFFKGVELIMKQLTEVLTKLGVEEIPALGETFDPELHNAIQHTDDPEVGQNIIVEVFQKGFRTGDKVVRPSLVKVAN